MKRKARKKSGVKRRKQHGNGAKITPKRLSFRLSVRALQAKVETEAEAKNGTVTAENHAEAVKFSSVREGFAGESGNRSEAKNGTATVRKSRRSG